MNITKASQALHISQPSVSQQLKLFWSGSEPNSCFDLITASIDGPRKIYRRRQACFIASRKRREHVQEYSRTNQTGTLRVGSSNNVSVNVLPKLLMAFKEPSVSSVYPGNPRAA